MEPKTRWMGGAAALTALAGLYFTVFSGQAQLRKINELEDPAEMEGAALQPLRDVQDLDPRKIRLGRELFNDARLSRDNTISCRSCHRAASGGGDGLQFSIGVGGVRGQVNAPSIYNSAFDFKQFWDGRADDLASQAEGPIHNPVEMGSNWSEVLAKLNADALMVSRFKEIYPDGLGQASLVDALVEFEKSLVTLNSPFDRYLNGEARALTPRQVSGYRKFSQYGCVACHQGRGVGGNMFQTMGIAHDYFKERGGHFDSDEGRFKVTGLEQDRHVFKVPSLRNVALSAPYFHDGTEKSLENAVRKMARYQLGRVLPEPDVTDITDFLRSLTGETPRTLEENTYETAD